MFPYIEIGNAQIGTYMLCALVGIFAAGIYVCRQAKKRGHDDNDFIVLMLISAIGVLAGGHLVYGITNIKGLYLLLTDWSKYVKSFDDFLNCISLIFGGSVFYGGLIGGTIAGFIYAKVKKFDLKEFSDICAPMVPLFHTFGRIGCFLGGCCYGIESEFGYTIHGNDLIPSVNDVNRFPVQLIEAGLNFMLFLLLDYLLRKDKVKGGLFALYLVIYAVIRFSDEFFRGDLYRGFLFGLSTSQIISIILFVCGGVYLINRAIKQKKQI